MDNENILVTGGTGFIGSKIVERLVRRGNALVVLDNNFRGTKERLKHLKGKIELIEGDIRNKDEVMRAAKNCRVVFHLAFINGTKYFYGQPELVLEVGVKGALNTLEVALENHIDKYILASSSEVYHQPDHVPTSETERILIPDVKNPRFSYSGGKIISELLTINYLRGSEVEYCIFRPHNIFGPQMGFDHVIPELIKKLYIATRGWEKKECEIEIQGTGIESRAFCFVDDAIDQIMLIFEKGKSGEIYHIGIDEEKSIRQLINDMSHVLNIQIKIIPGELPKGEPSRRCPSIDKVCSLGYEKKSHYEEGLRKTVEWYKNYFKETIGN
jgi:nucleoside-diphosphate-sugar epimerase